MAAVRLVNGGQGDVLPELLRIYEQAIPPSERKSRTAIEAMLRSPRHRVLVAEEHGRLLGFATVYVGERLALLEYLATDEQIRGQGLGAILFNEARLCTDDLPLIVEVESDAPPGPDRELRARRIGFYQRLGCRRIRGLDFKFPLRTDGQAPQLDLLLADWGDTIDRETLSLWLREFYACVYGCPEDDPRPDEMASRMPPLLKVE